MISIRKGNYEDSPKIIEMYKKLQIHLGFPNNPVLSSEALSEEMKKPNLYFNYLIVEFEEENKRNIIGYCLYYNWFSGFFGKSFHSEEIFVEEEYRRMGIGKQILQYLAKRGIEENKIIRMGFSTTATNEGGKAFLEKFGAINFTNGTGPISLIDYRYNDETLKKLANL